MNLTNGQAKAHDDIMRWMNNKTGHWCYKLAGFAGTGKTTLLQHIINQMEVMPFCCAPTGKAASVLEKKLEEALVTTVHKALYAPNIESTEYLEGLIMELKKDPDNIDLKQKIKDEKDRMKKAKLSFSSKLRPGEYQGLYFIVDEASMITPRMAEDFEKSGAKVLFVGDPGQLPPVKDAIWFGEGTPDTTLTEVMRQALDNPIIRLSMEIREKGYCKKGNYFDCDEVTITDKKTLSHDVWLNQDQVLVGSNDLRRRINRFFRKQYGYEEQKLPVKDEKLICLKNDFQNYGLINGVGATCLNNAEYDEEGELRLSVLFEDEPKEELAMYDYPFLAHYSRSAKAEPFAIIRDLAQFDWAYAITVHKSQGSEWRRVLLADDGFFSRNKDDRKKWLYTAITRAKEKFVWVQS